MREVKGNMPRTKSCMVVNVEKVHFPPFNTEVEQILDSDICYLWDRSMT